MGLLWSARGQWRIPVCLLWWRLPCGGLLHCMYSTSCARATTTRRDRARNRDGIYKMQCSLTVPARCYPSSPPARVVALSLLFRAVILASVLVEARFARFLSSNPRLCPRLVIAVCPATRLFCEHKTDGPGTAHHNARREEQPSEQRTDSYPAAFIAARKNPPSPTHALVATARRRRATDHQRQQRRGAVRWRYLHVATSALGTRASSAPIGRPLYQSGAPVSL